MKTCSVEGCSSKVRAQGFCASHYSRNRRYGSPTGMPVRETLEERFFSKVHKTDTCWNWTAFKDGDGYGQFQVGVRHGARAHRLSYELAHGPIPEGLVIDHKCHNTSCVNPDHLRAVTSKQNLENRQGLDRDNKSGVRGVYWCNYKRAYIARVTHHRKRYYAGTHSSLESAEAAVIAKRNELFTCNDEDRKRAAA